MGFGLSMAARRNSDRKARLALGREGAESRLSARAERPESRTRVPSAAPGRAAPRARRARLYNNSQGRLSPESWVLSRVCGERKAHTTHARGPVYWRENICMFDFTKVDVST